MTEFLSRISVTFFLHRTYHPHVLRIAHTIADLNASETATSTHTAEAIQYGRLEKKVGRGSMDMLYDERGTNVMRVGESAEHGQDALTPNPSLLAIDKTQK